MVSACLMGLPVRYDGGSKRCVHPVPERWQSEGRLRLLCPEMEGGLPTPRAPAEIDVGASGADVLMHRSHVVDHDGRDVSVAFVLGAERAVHVAREFDIRVAVLKEGSPSCGSSWIADGSFSGVRVERDGVTAAALRAVGVQVFSENQWDEAAACLAAIERATQSRSTLR
ncbi:DUF523 domain-containing protein [Diaphorobacter sp. HDW4A]|uniref:DUF523 domain-containing protein n=1 Tax=Diaphorobacter sp. HDW4A TaxID=2714924 RepID=UPI00352FF1EE